METSRVIFVMGEGLADYKSELTILSPFPCSRCVFYFYFFFLQINILNDTTF